MVICFSKKIKTLEVLEEPLLLVSEKGTFGESVDLPQSNQPIFAQIDIEPTILGHIANILYKTSQLTISLKLNNGTEKKYRIIAEMAKSGFIISPLIEDTSEFGMLYDNSLLNDKLVKSITITSDVEKSWLWNNNYTVTFSQIATTSPTIISKIDKFEGFDI